MVTSLQPTEPQVEPMAVWIIGTFFVPARPWLPKFVTPVFGKCSAARDFEIVLRDLELIQKAIFENVHFVEGFLPPESTPWFPV